MALYNRHSYHAWSVLVRMAIHLTVIVHLVPQLSLTRNDAVSFTCCVHKYES